MTGKHSFQNCAVVIIASGFDETEVIAYLSVLRQAGLCVQSVGLTSGLVNGAHGVWLQPDLSLTELNPSKLTHLITLAILTGGDLSLSRLEIDPRVHQFLHQVVAQGGLIAASSEMRNVLQAPSAGQNDPGWDGNGCQMILRNSGQPPEAFAQELIRRLRQPR